MSHSPPCCSPDEARAWVDLLTAEALDGDAHSTKMLPRVIAHWLGTLNDRR